VTAATYGADRTSLLVAATGFHQIGTHAAHEVNGPRFAHAVMTMEELLALPHTAKSGRHRWECSKERLP